MFSPTGDSLQFPRAQLSPSLRKSCRKGRIVEAPPWAALMRLCPQKATVASCPHSSPGTLVASFTDTPSLPHSTGLVPYLSRETWLQSCRSVANFLNQVFHHFPSVCLHCGDRALARACGVAVSFCERRSRFGACWFVPFLGTA